MKRISFLWSLMLVVLVLGLVYSKAVTHSSFAADYYLGIFKKSFELYKNALY